MRRADGGSATSARRTERLSTAGASSTRSSSGPATSSRWAGGRSSRLRRPRRGGPGAAVGDRAPDAGGRARERLTPAFARRRGGRGGRGSGAAAVVAASASAPASRRGRVLHERARRADDVPHLQEILTLDLAGLLVAGEEVEREALVGDLAHAVPRLDRAEQRRLHPGTGRRLHRRLHEQGRPVLAAGGIAAAPVDVLAIDGVAV